jgi:glycosyltransferase involved in cell wall biosynthesis
MRVRWIVPGALDQPTGGYIYDRLIVEYLREMGDSVELGDASNADVIVGDGLAIPELARLFPIQRVTRVLLVHHLGSWEPERTDASELRLLEALAIAASDFVIATSPRTRVRIVEQHPLAKCEVVTPGADRLPIRPRARKASGPLQLLHVGSLIPRKRVSSILDALPEKATLSLVGDETRDLDCAGALRAQVRLRGLEARVTFRGVLDDRRLADAMAQADALVLASSLEGYGMVITEALRAGLPVIVAHSAAEAVDLDDAFLLRFADTTELALLLREPERIRNVRPPAVGRTWRDAGREFRQVLSRAIASPVPEPDAATET